MECWSNAGRRQHSITRQTASREQFPIRPAPRVASVSCGEQLFACAFRCFEKGYGHYEKDIVSRCAIGPGNRRYPVRLQSTNFGNYAPDRAFHERVRAGYRRMAAADPARWRVIDASRSPDRVAAELLALVTAWLEEDEAVPARA